MSASDTNQSDVMYAQPVKEHRWLQKLIGEWTFESEASMGPDTPPITCRGTESVRPLGDLWVLAEGNSEMPGGVAATTLMTLGYDPEKKRFIGTFIGSMMTTLFIYDGELDDAEMVLALNTNGPDFTQPDKTVAFKDVIELKSEDHRILSSYTLGDDGQWHRFMSANYQRKK